MTQIKIQEIEKVGLNKLSDQEGTPQSYLHPHQLTVNHRRANVVVIDDQAFCFSLNLSEFLMLEFRLGTKNVHTMDRVWFAYQNESGEVRMSPYCHRPDEKIVGAIMYRPHNYFGTDWPEKIAAFADNEVVRDIMENFILDNISKHFYLEPLLS